MTVRMHLKVVRDRLPDEEGFWVSCDVPNGADPMKHVWREGWHVVAVRKPGDLQDGGPMHAAFLGVWR